MRRGPAAATEGGDSVHSMNEGDNMVKAENYGMSNYATGKFIIKGAILTRIFRRRRRLYGW